MRGSLDFVKKALGTVKSGVEVGVSEGYNANEIYTQMKPEILYLVDMWLPYVDNGVLTNHRPHFAKMMERFKDRPGVKIIQMSSMDAALTFPDESQDFVYIDANHTYDFVMIDIKSWLPKVKVGGYLCGHDYKFPDVARAVHDYFHDMEVKTFHNDDWLVKKERKVIVSA